MENEDYFSPTLDFLNEYDQDNSEFLDAPRGKKHERKSSTSSNTSTEEKLTKRKKPRTDEKRFVIHFGEDIKPSLWKFKRNSLDLTHLTSSISRKKGFEAFQIRYRDKVGDKILILDDEDLDEVVSRHSTLWVTVTDQVNV